MMRHKFFFSWDIRTLLLALLILLSIVLINFVIFTEFDDLILSIVISFPITALILYTISYVPIYISISSDNISIVCFFKREVIPLCDVKHVYIVPKEDVRRKKRVPGFFSLFPSIGRMVNHRLGEFKSYATNRRHNLVIVTKSDRFVVTCNRRNRLVSAFKYLKADAVS